jgi:hypothetical protein
MLSHSDVLQMLTIKNMCYCYVHFPGLSHHKQHIYKNLFTRLYLPKKVMDSAFNYCCEVVFQEVLHLTRYTGSLPGQFGGLLREKTKGDTLNTLKQTWDVYRELCKCALLSEDVKEEMRLCVWPSFSWVLEMLVGLDEAEFKDVPPLVKEEIAGWSRCPKSTKLIENVFNYCRGLMTARAKTMGADKVQHSCVQSQLDIEMDRPITKPSQKAKLDAPDRIDPLAFKANENKSFTLGDDMLEEFVESRVPEMSSTSFLDSGIRWVALMHAAPHFQLAMDYWLSLLCRKGMLLYRHDAPAGQPEGIVIGSNDCGALVLPVIMYSAMDKIWVKRDVSKEEFNHKFVHVSDTTDWKAVSTSCAGRAPVAQSKHPCTGLVFSVLREAPCSLEKLNAYDGFKALTKPRMQELALIHDIKPDGKVVRLENDWALLLVKHFLPSLSVEEQLMCVKRRNLKKMAPFTMVITDENLANLQKQGELDEDDVAGFKKAADTARLAKKLGASSLKVSKGATGSAPGFGYVPKGLSNKAYSLAEAKQYCPPRTACVLAIHKDKAWMIKCPYRKTVPKSHTATFDSWDNNRKALVFVLKWAWDVERELDPMSTCPYDWDAFVDE